MDRPGGVEGNRTLITGVRNRYLPVGRRPQVLVPARSQQPVDFSTPAVSQQTLLLTRWSARESNPHSKTASLVSSLWTSAPGRVELSVRACRHARELPVRLLFPVAGLEGVEPSSAVLEAALHPVLRPVAPCTGLAPVSLRRQRSCDTRRITRRSLLERNRTFFDRFRKAAPESIGSRRWGSRPESNRASALSQSALVTERVLPPQVRVEGVEPSLHRPERRVLPQTLHSGQGGANRTRSAGIQNRNAADDTSPWSERRESNPVYESPRLACNR